MTIDPLVLAGLEALLFLADEPVDRTSLASALEVGDEVVRVHLDELRQRLDERQSGLVVRHVGGGYRLYTSPLADEAVERHLLAGRSGKLSTAALETLAVIAWKQPITRGSVSDIRGVNADGAVRSLLARGLVAEVGRDEGPGQAVLFGTTTTFLEQLGLASIDELPPLTDYLDEVAPDEPVGDGLRRARKALAAGGRLPSTRRATWDGSVLDDAVEAETDMGADGGSDDAGRRRDDFRNLTEDLERVAEAAMSRLREVVEAADDPDAGMGGSNGDHPVPGSAAGGDGHPPTPPSPPRGDVDSGSDHGN